MNHYGRTGFAAIILVTGLLAACGGESASTALDATGTTAIVGNRGADLVGAAGTSASTGNTVSTTLKLSGTAATSVVAGDKFSFTPTAANAASTLTYSIANKPSWATFSTATGKLSGTPAAGDVGSYASITISATDGTASTSLSAFNVNVTAVGSNNLVLTWAAPSDNADGTPLIDLSGYKIHYGTTSGAYTKTITLANASLDRYLVDNLGSGTYYFAITAYNHAGTESQLSGEVSTTL